MVGQLEGEVREILKRSSNPGWLVQMYITSFKEIAPTF